MSAHQLRGGREVRGVGGVPEGLRRCRRRRTRAGRRPARGRRARTWGSAAGRGEVRQRHALAVGVQQRRRRRGSRRRRAGPTATASPAGRSSHRRRRASGGSTPTSAGGDLRLVARAVSTSAFASIIGWRSGPISFAGSTGASSLWRRGQRVPTRAGCRGPRPRSRPRRSAHRR